MEDLLIEINELVGKSFYLLQSSKAYYMLDTFPSHTALALINLDLDFEIIPEENKLILIIWI